jgi:hypothetical protein
MVLRHILAVLCEMFSVTHIVTDGAQSLFAPFSYTLYSRRTQTVAREPNAAKFK